MAAAATVLGGGQSGRSVIDCAFAGECLCWRQQTACCAVSAVRRPLLCRLVQSLWACVTAASRCAPYDCGSGLACSCHSTFEGCLRLSPLCLCQQLACCPAGCGCSGRHTCPLPVCCSNFMSPALLLERAACHVSPTLRASSPDFCQSYIVRQGHDALTDLHNRL